MSSVTYTVEEVLQEVSDLKGETETNTDANRIRFVSKAENNFATRKFWLIHLRRNVETTGDGSSVDFEIGSTTYPMRKNGLAELFVGGLTEDKRYQVVDFLKYQNLVNRDQSAKLAYEWYDQANDKWKVHLSQVVDNGTTIYYSYFYLPPKRTATSDTVICYDMDYIVNMTAAYVYQSEEDPEMASSYKNTAEQTMSDMEGLEVSPAHNQLKTMGAYQSQINDRGVGSY